MAMPLIYGNKHSAYTFLITIHINKNKIPFYLLFLYLNFTGFYFIQLQLFRKILNWHQPVQFNYLFTGKVLQ